MNSSFRRIIATISKVSSPSRTFSCSSVVQRNHGMLRGKPMRINTWREERDMPRIGNEYGPLTDLPDFRFLDGSPAPLSRGQRDRLVESEERVQRIQFLLKEINSAINNAKVNSHQVASERKQRIDSKLMEKGTPINGRPRSSSKPSS